MSGDYVERLRSFLDAHRPDSARHVTADVLATLPNPDGRGWRHLTGEDLRAALDELERLRAERDELREMADEQLAMLERYFAAYEELAVAPRKAIPDVRAILASNVGLNAENERLRAELAAIGNAEHQWRIVSPDGLIHSFTQRDVDHRADWLPGVRLEQRTVYGTPWVDADAVLQQPVPDGGA